MKKINLLGGVFLLITCTFSYASATAIAVTGQSSSRTESEMPITINNQANVSISTTSSLVPEMAKMIEKQDAVFFNIPSPQDVGTQRIRYANGAAGCDFYLDTRQEGPMMEAMVTYITAVPISPDSMCSVYTSGSVNHLAVAFTRMY